MVGFDEHEFDEHERARWAGRAAAYDRGFAPLCAYPVPALLDLASVDAGMHVLDVGTGTGTVAAAAVARGVRVSAVDADAGMVSLAAARVPAAEVRVAVLPGLPFADGTFDAVVANFVVNHVADPAAAIRELRRVVRPGGRVAVTVWPVPAPPAQQLWGRVFDAAQAERPAQLPRLDSVLDFPRTVAGVAGLLETAGLAGVRAESLAWTHRTDAEDWWSGPANGVATPGLIMEMQSPAGRARIRVAYDDLTAAFRDPDGLLALPTSAVLAAGFRA